MERDGPPLMREWDLLQDRLVPPLLQVQKRRPATVWSVGQAADAIAVTVAVDQARGAAADRLRVFASGDPAGGATVTFALSDLRFIPRADRDACFSRRDRRWIPAPSITDRVVLSDPTGPVDLLTVRSSAHGAGDALEGGADRLRPGGQLLLIDPPDGPVPTLAGLRALDHDGRRCRVFRKPGPGTGAGPGTGRPVGDGPVGGGPLDDPGHLDTLSRRGEREHLVEGHLRLARALARRFAHHGEPLDDLEQVALLALVKASRRFDPDRNIAFATFVTASILGELKRHFRDKTWMMRVPRSVQELYLSVKDAREELGHQLGAAPTVGQIASHLGVTEDAVLDAMEAGDSYWPASLDVRGSDDETGTDIPVVDRSFDRSLDVEHVRSLLPRLDPRERLILKRLYFDGWTQRQVAEEIGVSQMQVSRLLVRTIANLRSWAREG